MLAFKTIYKFDRLSVSFISSLTFDTSLAMLKKSSDESPSSSAVRVSSTGASLREQDGLLRDSSISKNRFCSEVSVWGAGGVGSACGLPPSFPS